MAIGIHAGFCIFSKMVSEYLKRKEQHNLRKYTLIGTTLNEFCELHSKRLEDNKTDWNEWNKLKKLTMCTKRMKLN